MTKLAKISPYSRPKALSGLDGRSWQAVRLRRVRASLAAHVGGRPSAVQKALIERAAQLQLRLDAFDRKFAATGEMTELDTRTYLAWVNTTSRVLRQLGLAAMPAVRA